MEKVKIALLGYGNVGSGTNRALEMNRKEIQKRIGKDIEVAKVLVRDPAKYADCGLPSSVLTTDYKSILGDPEIVLVAEVMGGIEPATTYMLQAMERGKNVVTANKAALAANWETLRAAAAKGGVRFLFEASVGGAIPVLNSITTVLQGNDFSEVMGIVNGTTNYILTKMDVEGASYEDALKKAQELGFAEADPTADVEGIDVANKLSILMALAFDKYVPPTEIPRKGISQITKADIAEANAKGCKIKLLAHAKRNVDGSVDYSVAPTLLPADHPLAGVSNEFNAVFITGNAAGDLMFYGRGAGPLPTGSAVLGDIIEILK